MMKTRRKTYPWLCMLLMGMLAIGGTGCGSSPGGTKEDLPATVTDSAAATSDSDSAVMTTDSWTLADGESDAASDQHEGTTDTDAPSDDMGTSPEDTFTKEIPSSDYADIRDSYTREELQKLSTRYSTSDNMETTYTFNGYGQNVSDAGKIRFRELKDVMTDETGAYSAEHWEFRRSSDGYYEDAQVESRLYSADGELILDWEPVVYENCLGDWITSHDYYDLLEGYYDVSPDGSMRNLNTGEVREGCFYLEKINEECAKVEDYRYSLMGLVDASGERMTTLPLQLPEAPTGAEVYLDSYKDYVTLYDDDESCIYIYTLQMKLLGYIPDYYGRILYGDTIPGPYVESDGRVYDPTAGDGGVLIPISQWAEVNYYDGERAVVGEYGDDGILQYQLVDIASGETLAGPYAVLQVPSEEIADPADIIDTFYGVDTATDTVVKLDRDGNILSSCPALGTTELAIRSKGIIGSYNWMVYDPRYDYYSYENISCLFDPDLEQVIPYGIYSYLYAPYTGSANVWIGSYPLSGSDGYRQDILDTTGQVLLSGCSDVTPMEDGNIFVRRGQYYGLVNENGEWLFRIRREELNNDD